MTGMIPEQEILGEMAAKTLALCPRPGIITPAVVLKDPRFLPYVSASWEGVIFCSFPVNCEPSPAFHQEAHIPVM